MLVDLFVYKQIVMPESTSKYICCSGKALGGAVLVPLKMATTYKKRHHA